MQNNNALSVMNDGVTHRKKSNETYAMVMHNSKTNEFTSFPIGQAQLSRKKNQNVKKICSV